MGGALAAMLGGALMDRASHPVDTYRDIRRRRAGINHHNLNCEIRRHNAHAKCTFRSTAGAHKWTHEKFVYMYAKFMRAARRSLNFSINIRISSRRTSTI